MESVLYQFQKLTKITQTVNIEKTADTNRIARTIHQITSICFSHIAIINLKVLRLDYMAWFTCVVLLFNSGDEELADVGQDTEVDVRGVIEQHAREVVLIMIVIENLQDLINANC